MQVPTLKPDDTAQAVVVIPDASTSMVRRLITNRWAPVALIVIVALVAVAVLATWEQGRVADARTAARTEAAQRLVTQRRATMAQAQVALLQQRNDAMTQKLENARLRAGTLLGRRAELSNQLAATQAALDDARGKIAEVIGPPLPAGRYIGYVEAVGTASTPARVVVDLGQWFTGQAATDAARADGAIASDQTVSRYLRDPETRWRILPLGPGATFTLVRWRGSLTPTSMDAAGFHDLESAPWPADVRAAQDPYWITVGSDGAVSALVEQRY